MKLLIQQAKIADPSSPHHEKVRAIYIENGFISSVSDRPFADLSKSAKVFNAQGQYVSPGWFDMCVNFRDPGFEYKEDIESGCRAAIRGGFTGVSSMPSTRPAVQSKAEVEYVRNKATGQLVDVYPVGALSAGLEGKDLAELYDMHLSGAVAFSDDKKPVTNAGLMIRALLYAKTFGGLILSFPDDPSISMGGKMNEGIQSTMLGLKGIPALAEEVMVARDIFLAEYAETAIHFLALSTARSVELVRRAKAQKHKITAGVFAHHLALDDSALSGFDTHFKVKPPFRTKKDIDALKKGLADGTIDVICSDHSPEDVETKKREFDHAAFGVIGLETAFAVAHTQLKDRMSTEDIVRVMAIRPRQILNLPVPVIAEGEKANLTIFDTAREWVFDEKSIQSKSKNTPFAGAVFTGKATAVYNNDQFAVCE